MVIGIESNHESIGGLSGYCILLRDYSTDIGVSHHFDRLLTYYDIPYVDLACNKFT